MADNLNMGGLSLGHPSAAEQNPTGRSYIPPHLRGKMGGANGGPDGPPPAGPPPAGGPPLGGPGPAPNGNMNGLNSSAWAG